MPNKTFEWRHIDEHTTDDDWQPVEAPDAWWAIKLGADKWDAEDRDMLRSGAAHVFEARDEKGNITRWVVHGEAQPVYYASPMPEQAS